LVGEGGAVPDADDQRIGGTEVVFEDIGEFGAGLGATKGAGVDHAATEGVAMHGFHQDRAGEFVGFSGVIFALVGAEVEGGFDFTGIVWRDAASKSNSDCTRPAACLMKPVRSLSSGADS
jgi:hypothetical protein